MAVEVFDIQEDGVPLLVARITTSDITGRVTRVEWENPSTYRWRVAVLTPSKADLVTIIEPGATGSRNVNQNQGYLIDGVLGAGYQVWNV